MTQRADSIEIWYGWVVVAVSLAIGTIAMAAPNLLFVSLKPIAADFGWPRAGPSMAFSLLLMGSGVGGIAMGWWMDKRGVMQPVLFGSVMLALGAILASHSSGRWDFYTANGLLMGAFGEAAMIAPLIANATRWFDRRRGLARDLSLLWDLCIGDVDSARVAAQATPAGGGRRGVMGVHLGERSRYSVIHHAWYRDCFVLR